MKSPNRFLFAGLKRSPSLRGSGLKYAVDGGHFETISVSLFTREWIEIKLIKACFLGTSMSPSLRGSGLKLLYHRIIFLSMEVSLFTREWIEIVVDGFMKFSDEGLPLYEGVD